jgi:hypothetical protein
LLDLEELGLDIDYVLPLVGSVVSQDANEAIIEWYANVTPNQCVTVNISGTQVQVLVTRLEGKLRGRVTPIACQTNPYNPNWQKVTLRFDENGGNANNFLYVEGYLFCLQIPQTFATAIINNMDWDAYGGGFTGVFGNVNDDNIVDDADLLQVLFNFGSNDRASDANGDGIVDDADLLTVLFNFGRVVLVICCVQGMRIFFAALTPSPSPTLWERDVGAHGGAPLHPSRYKARLPNGARAGKIVPTLSDSTLDRR